MAKKKKTVRKAAKAKKAAPKKAKRVALPRNTSEIPAYLKAVGRK